MIGDIERHEVRMVGKVALAAAVAYLIALYTPILSAEGGSLSFSDGGSPLTTLLLVGPLVMGALAILGIIGPPRLSLAAAGVAVSLIAPTMFITGGAALEIRYASEYDEEVGFSAALLFLIIAWVAAAAAGWMASFHTETKDPTPGRPHQLTSVLLGLVFIGLPFALLAEHDGISAWDGDSGFSEFAVLVWAIAPGLVGAMSAFRGTLRGVTLAAGVLAGQLILAVGMGQTSEFYGDGELFEEFSPYYLPGKQIILWMSIIGLVIAAAYLQQAGLFGATSTPTALTSTPSAPVDMPPPPGARPAQWAADPFGRHEHRYWDGQKWTDAVANGGITGSDPAVPAPPS